MGNTDLPVNVKFHVECAVENTPCTTGGQISELFCGSEENDGDSVQGGTRAAKIIYGSCKTHKRIPTQEC
eukprot:4009107-Pyramimonas_sp.AAC.1